MIKYLPILFVIFTLLSVSPAISIAEEPSANDPCTEALTTVEMRECLNTQYTKVDGELNHVYRQVMSQLEKARKTKFRETQRAWLGFRDKSAEFEASAVEGGSMYPLVYLSTLTSLTEKRRDQLKDILQGLDSQ